MLQKPGDRVNRLLHRGHADQSLKQVGLGEPTLDRDGEVLVQRRNGVSTTFFRLEVVTLSAGRLLAFGKRHEGAPANDINLSFLCGFPGSAENMLVRKLAKY
jgi:hypothetical protein